MMNISFETVSRFLDGQGISVKVQEASPLKPGDAEDVCRKYGIPFTEQIESLWCQKGDGGSIFWDDDVTGHFANFEFLSLEEALEQTLEVRDMLNIVKDNGDDDLFDQIQISGDR